MAPMLWKPSSASSSLCRCTNPCRCDPPEPPAPSPWWNPCRRDPPAPPGQLRKKWRRPAHDYRPPPQERTCHHDTSLDGYIRQCPDLFDSALLGGKIARAPVLAAGVTATVTAGGAKNTNDLRRVPLSRVSRVFSKRRAKKRKVARPNPPFFPFFQKIFGNYRYTRDSSESGGKHAGLAVPAPVTEAVTGVTGVPSGGV